MTDILAMKSRAAMLALLLMAIFAILLPASALIAEGAEDKDGMKDDAAVPSAPAETSGEGPEQAPAGEADYAGSWRSVLVIAGGRPDADIDIGKVLGEVPSRELLDSAGAMTPAEFEECFKNGDERTKQVMHDLARARLRELARRGVLDHGKLGQIIGADMMGLAGSGVFAAPPIPRDSYEALVFYIDYAANIVSGGSYESSSANRGRINRALQVTLAISSKDVRAQYRDFDLVWAEVRSELLQSGAGSEERRLPSLLWLYSQVRNSTDLEWLPAPGPELQEAIDADGGILFADARQRSALMPPSLAAATIWKCP